MLQSKKRISVMRFVYHIVSSYVSSYCFLVYNFYVCVCCCFGVGALVLYMFCLLRFLGPRRSVFWVFSFLAAPLPRAAARAPTATTT